MNAVPSLMSTVRPCPNCEQTESVVDYWEHSGVRDDLGVRVIRYQCKNCSHQTTDLPKSEPDTMAELMAVMAEYVGVDTDYYLDELANDYYYDGSELAPVA